MLRAMRRMRVVLAALLLGAAAFLGFAPTRVAPLAWRANAAPALARNDALRGMERLAAGVGVGPETVLVARDGRLVTGYVDGRVVSFAADGSDPRELANTHGRPLGLAFHPDGSLLVAAAARGLLRVARDGAIEVLADAADGVPFGFCDFVVVDAAGAFAYFSDASAKWHFGEHALALLEHGGDGRLLRYDFATRSTQVLLDRLEFANGVALAQDESYVLVAETGAYRVTRLWLAGPRAGTRDVFVDDLPGFPDNLGIDAAGTLWVAIPAPRDALLDALADSPRMRRAIARVVERFPALHPPPRHAMALAFDRDARPVANLQAVDGYTAITHVAHAGAWLYFGSLEESAIGRIAAP
jgi:sugar lactone lactonase YvrE